MLLVVIVGAFYIKAANYTPVHPAERRPSEGHRRRPVVVLVADRAAGSHFSWYGVLAGASIVFFAFIGFDVVATTAEETTRSAARRTLRHPGLARHRHRALRRGVAWCCRAWCPTPCCAMRRTATSTWPRPSRPTVSHWAAKVYLDRSARGSHHRGDRPDARTDPGAVRHVAATVCCRAKLAVHGQHGDTGAASP